MGKKKPILTPFERFAIQERERRHRALNAIIQVIVRPNDDEPLERFSSFAESHYTTRHVLNNWKLIGTDQPMPFAMKSGKEKTPRKVDFEGDRVFEHDIAALAKIRCNAIEAIKTLFGSAKCGDDAKIDELFDKARYKASLYIVIRSLNRSKWDANGKWIGPVRLSPEELAAKRASRQNRKLDKTKSAE